MIDYKNDYTVEEVIEIARGVKPTSHLDQFTVETFEKQGVWPYDDANTGYVAPAEYRDPEPAPADIAAMMKAGGNPFVIDGIFDRRRILMHYDAALAEQKRMLNDEADQANSDEPITDSEQQEIPSQPEEPVAPQETPALQPQQVPVPAPQQGKKKFGETKKVPKITATAVDEEHPVGETFGACFAPVMQQIPAVAGTPIPGNIFTGPNTGVTAVAEVVSDNDGMIDPTAAWGSPMPVEEVPPQMVQQPLQGYVQQAPMVLNPAVMQYMQMYQQQMEAMAAQQQPRQPIPMPASIPLQVTEPKKAPKPKKNEADKNVTVGAAPVQVIPNKRDVPEIVQGAAQEAKAPVEHDIPQQLVSCFPQNAQLYNSRQLGFLKEIEDIALNHGHQVFFNPHINHQGNLDGLIEVAVYDPSGKNINTFKSFVIDTGRIIDRRVKIFPVFPVDGKVLENVFPFEAFVKGGSKNNGGGKKLNVEMFRDIFIGGVAAIKAPPMYTKELMELNRHIDYASISFPKGTDKMRIPVRDKFLLPMLKRGTFDKINEVCPHARFRMTVPYNVNTNSIVFENLGVPSYYNGPCVQVHHLRLTVTEGDAKVEILAQNVIGQV